MLMISQVGVVAIDPGCDSGGSIAAALFPARRMRGFALTLALAVSFLVVGPSGRAEMPPTNEELVVNSIASAVQTFIDTSKIASSDVFIEPVGQDDDLALDGVRAAFITSGWQIIDEETEGHKPEYRAITSLNSLDFTYKRGGSRGFLRKPLIKREYAGQILLKLISNQQDYLGFLDFSGSDEVAPSQANYVASLKYKQLAPEEPGGGIVKLLEPVAVTATIGGLIYLFFINR